MLKVIVDQHLITFGKGAGSAIKQVDVLQNQRRRCHSENINGICHLPAFCLYWIVTPEMQAGNTGR